MNLKRLLVMSLSFLLLLSMLFSCGKKATDGTDASLSTQDTISQPDIQQDPNQISIAENGEVLFKIVYPPVTSDKTREDVDYLRKALEEKSKNSIVSLVEAFSNPYDANALEILIGDTGYPESNQVMKSLAYGDWSVQYIGNKMVVAASSWQALGDAITEAIKVVKKGADGNGNIKISRDLKVIKTADKIINELPVYDTASASCPQTIDTGDDASLALFRNSTVEEYENYLAKLEKNGYTFYDSNVIVDNRFATYINDTHLIHAGWYAYENAVRVTIEPKTALAVRESDNKWSPVSGITTSLAQVSISTAATDYNDCGMGYIWQLADGSFIVIDGGYASNATQLYNYMKAKAPNGKIVIAAWILTHPDNDHRLAFKELITKHANDITLERFISNHPSAHIASGIKYDALALASETPGCEVIKAHPGMKFFLRNAVIEVLFTTDSRVPSTSNISANNSSIVFTVEAEGEKALFTGDMGDSSANVVANMYGTYLKSDILQVAHHGHTNGAGTNPANMCRFYRFACAEVVIWPTSEGRYLNDDGLKGLAHYGMNLVAIESARETWVAGTDKITVFEFPYTPFSAYQFDILNPHPSSVSKDGLSDGAHLWWETLSKNESVNEINWSDFR